MTRDDRLRIAVFIDFDNIEIGVKNTLGASFDAGLVLEALKERGDVVSKTAYSDWQRAGGYSRSLTQHAIKMVQRNLTPGGDKNGADINLALDALEMAFTHPHINAFVIVGGDSDFISLVEKLKQYDKKIFVVGGRQFTSIIMQKNCHEFIAYENLVGASTSASSGGGRRQSEPGRVRVERVPIEQAIPLVTRGLKVLADREVSPQLGLLKSTLLQLDSTFSERSYGAGSFRDFVEKLEKLGVLKLQQVKGGLLVTAADDAPLVIEPSRGAEEGDQGVEAGERGEASDQPVDQSDRHRGREPRAEESGMTSESSAAPAQAGSMADGLKEFREVLASGQVRRWPMYLRNVKQLIKQVTPGFDERAYGFANLVDLLRAAGRDGLVRVDRDRQGVIRVFQGAAAPVEAQPAAPKIFDIEDELAEAAAAAAAAAPMPVDIEPEMMRDNFNSDATSDESDRSGNVSPAAEDAEAEDEDEGDGQRSLLPAAKSGREVDGNRVDAKLDTPGHALARGRARRPPRTGRSSAAAPPAPAKPAPASRRAAAPRARKTTKKS